MGLIMAKKSFNPIDNLKPVRTKEEARERGRAGGIASGKARAEQKYMSGVYARMFAKKFDVNIDGELQKLEGTELFEKVVLRVLLNFDSSTVAMFREMGDKLEGKKVSIDVTGRIEEVQKLAREIMNEGHADSDNS